MDSETREAIKLHLAIFTYCLAAKQAGQSETTTAGILKLMGLNDLAAGVDGRELAAMYIYPEAAVAKLRDEGTAEAEVAKVANAEIIAFEGPTSPAERKALAAEAKKIAKKQGISVADATDRLLCEYTEKYGKPVSRKAEDRTIMKMLDDAKAEGEANRKQIYGDK